MAAGGSNGMGNMNPVTQLATVVIRKSAVVLGKCFAFNIASATTMPLTMPIRLMIT